MATKEPFDASKATDDDLMTIGDLAKLARVSKGYLYSNKHLLPPRANGVGIMRFRFGDVKEWLKPAAVQQRKKDGS